MNTTIQSMGSLTRERELQAVMRRMNEAIEAWDQVLANDTQGPERDAASIRWHDARKDLISNSYPTTGCAGCGDCCELAFLSISEDVLKKTAADPPENWSERNRKDYTFMAEHWRELSPEEAAEKTARIFRDGLEVTDGQHMYTCGKFDAETRRCTAYTDRPPICSEFPYYGRKPAAMSLPSKCSYWRDVPQTEWPEHAEPMVVLEGGVGCPQYEQMFKDITPVQEPEL